MNFLYSVAPPQSNHTKSKVPYFLLNISALPSKLPSKKSVYFDKIISLNKNIDVVVGGPPCQAYSTSGKRMLSDPRGRLFVEYGKAISVLKPKLFIYENVKGLLSMNKGKLIDEIVEMFSDLGYKIDIEVLNAGNYGVPQERKRVILVGTAKGIQFSYPEKVNKLEKLIQKKSVKVKFIDGVAEALILNKNNKG